MDTARFDTLYAKLMQFDLTAKAKVPFKKPEAKAIEPLLSAGALHLPAPFRRSYSEPLEHHLAATITRLGGDTSLVETVCGAVYQHGEDGAREGALRRFLAVVSNLYRSFLDNSKRRHLSLPLRERLPPLASFQSDPDQGPYTLTCDTVAQLFDASVGVVSMPATFAPHPFFFGSLAHETGGHDVLHADPGLLSELRGGIHKLFADHDWLGVVWDYWLDEAASDVYGTLNIGPTFGASLAMLLSVYIGKVEAQNAKPKSPLHPRLRTQSGAGTDGALDWHPTDILRLALVQGVVDTLEGLSPARRRAYNESLDAIAALTVPDAMTVELAGYVRLDSGRAVDLNHSVPLDDFRAAARRVGQYIATARLHAFNGLSVQDIETWDDSDEQAANHITSRLTAGASIVGAGDDAQLLAGATLACLAQPDDYAKITARLEAALDDSFAIDPFWGVPVLDRFVLQSKRALPPPEPKADPYAERIIDFNPLEEQTGDPLGIVTFHQIAPIPWPKGSAPTPRPLDKAPALSAALPEVDYVIVTWTAAEANALSAVLTPGYLAMPPSGHKGGVWYRYGHDYDAYLPKLTPRSPARTSHDLGKYFLTTFGKKKVLCFKSSLHLARDTHDMPIRDLLKQIIGETKAKLVISTGTAGGIGSHVELGDVVATTRARFDCKSMFKNEAFNGKTYSSTFKVADKSFLGLVNDKLIAANAGQLPRAARPPKVFTTTEGLGEPSVIVTTDIFAFDDATNYYGLQGLGAMVEMDDAVLGLACDELRQAGEHAPGWIAIRNASDPQMKSIAEKAKSAKIYEQYGYWTSIPSVLASWAVVMGS